MSIKWHFAPYSVDQVTATVESIRQTVEALERAPLSSTRTPDCRLRFTRTQLGFVLRGRRDQCNYHLEYEKHLGSSTVFLVQGVGSFFAQKLVFIEDKQVEYQFCRLSEMVALKDVGGFSAVVKLDPRILSRSGGIWLESIRQLSDHLILLHSCLSGTLPGNLLDTAGPKIERQQQ